MGDPFDKRQKPELRDTAIMNSLNKACAEKVPEAQFTVLGASAIPGLGTAGGFKFIVEDRGDLGLVALQQQTDGLIQKLQKVPGLSRVTTQFRSKTPQLFLDIDRDKAASLGVSLDDVNQTLGYFHGLELRQQFQRFRPSLAGHGPGRRDLSQPRGRPQPVPGSKQVWADGPAGHPGPPAGDCRPDCRRRVITFTRRPPSAATSRPAPARARPSRPSTESRRETLPLSMKADWTELMFLQKRVGDTSIYVFFLAIVSVFLALSALYESWSLPLAVILVVPLCLLCSVAGVLFTQRDVNIFVQIGLVVLVGLACKNAILVVEYAKQLHLEGRSAFEATKEASRLRLRPILMTSFAFIFGVIPLMTASGAGAEMRRSLGVAVFSGMFGVTLVRHLPHAGVLLRHYRAGRVPPVRFRRFPADCLLLPGRPLGLAGGFLLGKLGVVRLPWSAIVGACAGVLVVLAILEIHRRIKPKAAAPAARPLLLPLPPWNPMEDRTRDPLLCRSSHLLHGHLRRFRAGGRSGRVHAAHGPVPGGHAADRARDGPLSGRQRLDRARHRGGADRGAGQRRRGHGLHVVALAPTTAPTT